MLLAAGTFGKPGIVNTLPDNATIKPAPTDGFNSLILTIKSVGLPNTLSLSESDY